MGKSRINVVEQNLGMWDRIFRFILGCIMLAVPYYYMTQTGKMVEAWYGWSMVISVYPFLTSIIGCDVLYNFFHVKSCDLSNRNRCGSFPFEVDAFLGHNPIPEDDTEHTLAHSRHDVGHV